MSRGTLTFSNFLFSVVPSHTDTHTYIKTFIHTPFYDQSMHVFALVKVL